MDRVRRCNATVKTCVVVIALAGLLAGAAGGQAVRSVEGNGPQEPASNPAERLDSGNARNPGDLDEREMIGALRALLRALGWDLEHWERRYETRLEELREKGLLVERAVIWDRAQGIEPEENSALFFMRASRRAFGLIDTQVTDAGVEALKEALPELSLRH